MRYQAGVAVFPGEVGVRNWARGLRAVAAVMVLSCFPFTACQAMYKCEQPNGNMAYQETPCASNTQTQPMQAAPPQPEAPPPSGDAGVDQAQPANTPVPGTPPPMLQQPAPVATGGDTAGTAATVPPVDHTNDRSGMLAALMVFALIIFLFYAVVRSAQRKGRSGLVWFIIAFFINPIPALLLLGLMGDA